MFPPPEIYRPRLVAWHQKGGILNRHRSEDKLAQFSNRLVQIKFIVLEIAMLVVFIAAVLALVRHELGF